jgi:hypothetical protein
VVGGDAARGSGEGGGVEVNSISIGQLRQQAIQVEAELTDLCIVTGLSRNEAMAVMAKSTLSAGELASFYRTAGHFPGEGHKSMSINWTELANFALVDDRSRFEKVKAAVEALLLDRLYKFWYGLFYLLFGLVVTPVRAAWDSLKDTWGDAGCGIRED